MASSFNPFVEELATLHPALVVWDVFNKLHTQDERRPDQVLPILKRIDRIRDTLGCANLLAHHSRKPSARGPDLASGGQRLRGPSEFWGWAENSPP
jgi:RecA-family ATPase